MFQETAAGPMSAKAPEAKEKSKKNIPKSAALLQDASIVGVQSAHLSPVTCSTPVKALPGKRCDLNCVTKTILFYRVLVALL